MKQETEELIRLIQDYVNGSVSYQIEPFDSNHFFERNFRLYIDGSYTYPRNEDGFVWLKKFHNRLREIIKTSKPATAYKKLRSVAIEMEMQMLKVEFPGLSFSTIQRTMVKHFKPKDLELLNHHLVDELMDVIKENNLAT